MFLALNRGRTCFAALGRSWTNALLATDDIPGNVMSQITMKSFGRNRTYTGENPPAVYQLTGGRPKKPRLAVELRSTGNLRDSRKATKRRDSNIAFWRKNTGNRKGREMLS